ncbi:MAG: hypothetical protein LH615_06600, partial [Ferruginibacter sp.]|nr:hypothetical protein [Ferruginibacter sp.]
MKLNFIIKSFTSKKMLRISSLLKSLLIFAIIACTIQTKSFGQITSDESLVPQKCLDINAVQVYFPFMHNGSNEKQQFQILQYPYNFSTNASPTKSGKTVLFVSRDYTKSLYAHMSFSSFLIVGNAATAACTILCDRNSANHRSVAAQVK